MDNPLQQAPMYHATPIWNFAPILKRGIDPEMSRGQLPVSWYVAEERAAWAIYHTLERFKCELSEVIVFEVEESLAAWYFIAPQPLTYRTARLLRPTAVYPSYNWFPEQLERK